MSGIKRLPCLQHIKRKFLDLKDDPQAQEIAKLFGLLYHFEHKHRTGEDGWTAEKHLEWRQRYSKVMLEKIRMRLTAVKDRIGVPPMTRRLPPPPNMHLNNGTRYRAFSPLPPIGSTTTRSSVSTATYPRRAAD